MVKSFRPKSVNLVHRNAERAAAFRKYVKETLNFNEVRTVELFSTDVMEKLVNSKLIINATPIGMWPRNAESVIEAEEAFSEDQIVFDLVYTPLETKFLQLAKGRGSRTISGLEMFVYQGAKSFELWTDQQMPVEQVRKTIIDKLHSMPD